MDLKTLSDAAAPASNAAVPTKAVVQERELKPYEPMVHGESAYDRVSSMLMSLVIGASIIVGWLWLINFTNRAYAQKTPPPVELIEVYGDGTGGAPDGEAIGQGESKEIPNAAAGAMAANTTEDAGAFEEPAEQATSSVALDPFAAPSSDASEGAEVASDTPSSTGGVVASGQRRSVKGNGIKGLGTGTGTGPGGVARELRWRFEFAPGQDETEYGRMLDFFGIELATGAGSNTLMYASNFMTTPVTHTGLSKMETRMYTTWSSPTRKKFDVQLLNKAGVKATEQSLIMQFLPKKLEDKLAQTEYAYKGRQPGEIRQTKFKCVASGSSFEFQVISQDLLK